MSETEGLKFPTYRNNQYEEELTGEPAVVMKRLPEEQRMDHLARSGKLTRSETQELAETLANFHKSCDACSYHHLLDIWKNHWKEFHQLALKACDQGIISTNTLKHLATPERIEQGWKQLEPIVKEEGAKGYDS